MKAHVDRNRQIVVLRDQNPKKYTFGILAQMFKLSRPSVQEIYYREKAKLGDKKALAHPLIRRKYPALLA